MPGSGHDPFRDAHRTRERPPVLAVDHELDTDEQSPTADLTYGRVVADPCGQRRLEHLPLCRTRLDEMLVAKDPEHLAGDRGPHRRMRVREAMDETASWRGHRGVDVTRRRDEPERPVSGCRALRGHEHVRAQPPMI